MVPWFAEAAVVGHLVVVVGALVIVRQVGHALTGATLVHAGTAGGVGRRRRRRPANRRHRLIVAGRRRGAFAAGQVVNARQADRLTRCAGHRAAAEVATHQYGRD